MHSFFKFISLFINSTTVIISLLLLHSKPCNCQKNIDNCMREKKTKNVIKYLVGENFGTMLVEACLRPHSFSRSMERAERF